MFSIYIPVHNNIPIHNYIPVPIRKSHYAKQSDQYSILTSNGKNQLLKITTQAISEMARGIFDLAQPFPKLLQY